MIELQGVTIHAGSFRLRNLTTSIPQGAYGVLMGRTGSGKTTLLEAVCGLKHVAAGAIRLDGQDVTDFLPGQRGIGFVPQDGALFQSMTVEQHLRFALDIRKWDQQRAQDRVSELADMLRIAPLLERRPHGLSGGERQRVALGRALSFHPSILCLDEPLSALDDETREEMMVLLKQVQQESKVTALHVTHSQLEAQRLADCWLRIDDGAIAHCKV